MRAAKVCWLASSLSLLYISQTLAQTTTPPPQPTPDPEVVKLKAEKDRLDAEKALLEAQLGLMNAKEALYIGDAAKNAKVPGGEIASADKYTFPGYVAALLESKAVANELCAILGGLSARTRTTVEQKDSTTFYLVDSVLLASLAQTQSLAFDLEQRVKRVNESLKSITESLAKPPEPAAMVSGLEGAIFGLNVLGGLVQSVAGFAQLFRSDITYFGVDVDIAAADLAAMMRNCSPVAPAIFNPIDMVSIPRSALLGQLSEVQLKIDALLVLVEGKIKQLPKEPVGSTTGKPNPEATRLGGIKQSIEKLQADWGALMAGLTKVDAETKLSPLALMERNQFVIGEVTKYNNAWLLSLAVRRAGATTRTKKNIFSSKQHFAGGVSVRYQVQDASGAVVKSGIAYGHSNWFSVPDDNTGKALAGQL